jgi:hypothetical protein
VARLSGTVLLPVLAALIQVLQQFNTNATILFGERIEFYAAVFPGDQVTSASVSVKNPASEKSWILPSTIVPGRTATLKAMLDLSDYKLAPFSIIEYAWAVTHTDGSLSHSVAAQLEYRDDRFDWNILKSGDWQVYSPSGNDAVAELSLAAVLETAEKVTLEYSLEIPNGVRVILYPTREDLSSGVGDELILGHAEPAQGLLYASGDHPDLLSIIKHELMHLAIFARTGDGYAQIPAWLNEGLSTLMQESEVQSMGDPIPLESLCSPPLFRSPSAEQAYIQSAAVVAFIRDRYGKETIIALLDAYAEEPGVTCDAGLEEVLELSVNQLEDSWRQNELGEQNAPPSFAPWLLLGLPAVIAIAASLSLRIQRRQISN